MKCCRRFLPIVFALLASVMAYEVGRLDGRPALLAAAQTRSAGDVNADGAIDISDPVYLLTYLFLAGPPPATIEAPSQTLTALVVRHAEKGSGTDPDLTPDGQVRAQHLKDILARTQIDAVVSTNYKRTLETVQPAADVRSLPVQTFADADVKTALATTLRSLPAGSTALVAGNSFNLSDIVKALGVSSGVTVGSDEYDNLWVVRFGASEDVAGAVIHLRY